MRFVLPLLLLALSCDAAVWYIRSGATGDNDGSSWANALTAIPSSWTRGDTYYIAGGSYGQTSVSVSGAGTATLKKANAGDNGSDPGWSSSYASTVASISCSNSDYCLRFMDGGVEINGVTGTNQSGHGILITNSYLNASTEPAPLITLAADTAPFYLRHIELAGTGFETQVRGGDGIYQNNTGTKQKGLHIAYVWIHGVDRNGMTLGGFEGTSYTDYGLLFENSVISSTGGSSDLSWHGQGIQLSYANTDNYTIFRGNIFQNIKGSGMFVYMNGDNSHNNSRVYNNIFMITNAAYDLLSPHCIGNIGGGNCTNILIANNTFYGIESPSLAQVRFYGGICDSVQFSNNVFEGCYFSDTHTVNSQGYNGYYGNTGGGVPIGTPNQVDGDSTTFNAPLSYDFTLKVGGYAVGAGIDLSSIFTTDYAGNTRTTWDIGAYAYNAKKARITNVRVQNLTIGVPP